MQGAADVKLKVAGGKVVCQPENGSCCSKPNEGSQQRSNPLRGEHSQVAGQHRQEGTRSGPGSRSILKHDTSCTLVTISITTGTVPSLWGSACPTLAISLSSGRTFCRRKLTLPRHFINEGSRRWTLIVKSRDPEGSLALEGHFRPASLLESVVCLALQDRRSRLFR